MKGLVQMNITEMLEITVKINSIINTFFKKDANINKWAYNKPFDTSMLAREVLFDANAEDRRAANHGFDQISFFG